MLTATAHVSVFFFWVVCVMYMSMCEVYCYQSMVYCKKEAYSAAAGGGDQRCVSGYARVIPQDYGCVKVTRVHTTLGPSSPLCSCPSPPRTDCGDTVPCRREELAEFTWLRWSIGEDIRIASFCPCFSNSLFLRNG